MKKKAILISKIFDLLLGALVLIALFYAGYKVFSLLTEQTQVEQLKIHIQKIGNIANNLEDGSTEEYFLESPYSRGFLVGFSSDLMKDMPKKCKEAKNCVCLCLAESHFSLVRVSSGDLAKFCDNVGECREVRKELLVVNTDGNTSNNPYPITVSSLIDEKKSLTISYNSGLLRIYPSM